MQATGNLPSTNHVLDIMSRLLGEETFVRESASSCKIDQEEILATYIGNDDKTRALLICDIAFAVRAGASLTMIPPATVEESILTKSIPTNVADNLSEILNICVNLFMDAYTDRLHLGSIVRLDSELDDCAREVLKSKQRADFDVEIPRYGWGRIALLIGEPHQEPA